MKLDWGEGSYEDTGRQLAPAAEVAVARAEIRRGESVLDLGCGTGNAALVAARLGAAVTAVDPAARLVDVARQRAAAEGLPIDFAVAEAAELGLPDASFDAAVAVFSIIFADDAEAAAAGLMRAVRPGGRAVITTWIPEGAVHDSSRVLVAALGGAERASPWLEVDSIRALFAPARVTISEETVPFTAASPIAWFESLEREHPFWRLARNALIERGDYAPLREEALAILTRANEDPSAFRSTSQYRVVRIDRPA